MQNVTLYTDGAARGNPDGPGGYGAVLQFVDSQGNLHEREFSAGYIRLHHQQPDGADGGDRRSGSADKAVPGGNCFRFEICDGCV